MSAFSAVVDMFWLERARPAAPETWAAAIELPLM
jgi:hypothetical protein